MPAWHLFWLESVLFIEGAATLREAPWEGLPMAIIVGLIYLAFSAALLYAVRLGRAVRRRRVAGSSDTPLPPTST